jgi:hypothetical protein
MLDKLKKPEVRKYLYQVGVAVMALLAIYGVVNPDQVEAWVVLLGALVGAGLNGMSAYNTK